MLTILFYVVIAWILFSFGVGVYTSVVKGVSQERAIAATVTTLRLPYDVVVKLFK